MQTVQSQLSTGIDVLVSLHDNFDVKVSMYVMDNDSFPFTAGIEARTTVMLQHNGEDQVFL